MNISSVRAHILLMEPLPPINKFFSLVLQVGVGSGAPHPDTEAGCPSPAPASRGRGEGVETLPPHMQRQGARNGQLSHAYASSTLNCTRSNNMKFRLALYLLLRYMPLLLSLMLHDLQSLCSRRND